MKLTKTNEAIENVIDYIDEHYLTGDESEDEYFEILSRIDAFIASKIKEIFIPEVMKKIIEGTEEEQK